MRGCAEGLEESVREDFTKLKESPLIGPDIKIYGFVYDVTVRALDGSYQG